GALALDHALVALAQQRGRLVVLLLPKQRPAQHRLRVEGRPGVGLRLLADEQALAQHRLGGGELIAPEQGQRHLSQQGRRFGTSLGELLPLGGDELLQQRRRLLALLRVAIWVVTSQGFRYAGASWAASITPLSLSNTS